MKGPQKRGSANSPLFLACMPISRLLSFLPSADSERVLRSRLFNCAQIAEKAITTIILLPHKTDITKRERERNAERANERDGGGRRARYGITATLFWLAIRTVDGTGMNFNLGDVVISGLKEGWSGHCLDEWSSE